MATIRYMDGKVEQVDTIEQAMMRVLSEGYHFSENDDSEGAEPFFDENGDQAGEVA